MEKLIGNDHWCFVCGGKGFPDKECPSCGLKPTKGTLNLEHKENVQEFVERIDSFGVPAQYRGVTWNADTLKRSKRDKANDLMFQKYVEQLEKVNDFFVRGVLSPKSAIIIAPAGYSKMVFAFSCMQRALDNGFTVAPFLDSVELKRALILAGENPSYKINKKVSYEDYVLADVCFVTVTKMKAHEWAFEVIEELLDRRSRKGLSTFIISRFGLNEISRRDYSNQFDVISTAFSKDAMKYPAIIKYTDL
jgi:hypothetical protein